MKPGTKPTPTALKELRGTARKDRQLPDEVIADALETLPAVPEWLNEWAKDEWYTVVTWLHSVRLLSAIDTSIVAAYCQQMGIFRLSEEMLKKDRVTVTDKGYEMASPWVNIGNKALMLALKIAAEYGLTPSSRSRISMPPKKEVKPTGLFSMMK